MMSQENLNIIQNSKVLQHTEIDTKTPQLPYNPYSMTTKKLLLLKRPSIRDFTTSRTLTVNIMTDKQTDHKTYS